MIHIGDRPATLKYTGRGMGVGHPFELSPSMLKITEPSAVANGSLRCYRRSAVDGSELEAFRSSFTYASF